MLTALQQQQLKLAPDLNWETLWPSLSAELQAQAQRTLTISQFALHTFAVMVRGFTSSCTVRPFLPPSLKLY